MIDYTGRPFRAFMRQLTRHTLFYTEMISAYAVLFGDRDKHLRFEEWTHPIALQLGGDDPEELARAASIAMAYGYDEVNLNCGCPSERVQSGHFGAALMANPERVRDCIQALSEATDRPVTVKHRIGIAPHDSYDDLLRFVLKVAEAPCQRFIIHARSAVLQNLNPKQNRQTPLRRELVFQLKREHPELTIELNGNISTLDEASEILKQADGAMIGRAAFQNAYLFAEADQKIFGDPSPIKTRAEAVNVYLPFVEEELRSGASITFLLKPLHSLCNGLTYAKQWRMRVSTAKTLGDIEDAVRFLNSKAQETPEGCAVQTSGSGSDAEKVEVQG